MFDTTDLDNQLNEVLAQLARGVSKQRRRELNSILAHLRKAYDSLTAQVWRNAQPKKKAWESCVFLSRREE